VISQISGKAIAYKTQIMCILLVYSLFLPTGKLCIFGDMETTAKPSNNHIGRKISRIRELRGIKQETMASELGVSQQTVSRIEQSETIEDDVLAKVAGVLGVSADAIKNYSDEAVIYNIQNNYEGSHNQGPVGTHNICNFNPLDKLVELFEENKKLYERLLQAEKEKNELLKDK
jgi:transcriptional regulator with XRE-family HTH domain